MAEVLGVVAGSAGLAQLASQLAGSCIKIRRLYTSYKEAPGFLADTLEDMEGLARFLRLLERDHQRRQRGQDGDDILRQYVGRCHRATARVKRVVDELEAVMEKSSIRGRVSTLFKQEPIKNLCDELEKAKTSLMLALELYKLSCQTEDTNRIIDTMDQNKTILIQQFRTVAAEITPVTRPRSLILQNEPQKPSETESRGQLSRRRQHDGAPRRRQQHLRIRLQPWFTHQLWEVSLSVAQFGFDFSLRTCNFVSHKSLIFDACRRGDLAGVQTLFRSGQATPFDCSSDLPASQRTVLTEAAASGNAQLCRYLVDLAGYPVRPNGSLIPIEAYRVMHMLRTREASEIQEMYRMLLQDPNMAPLDLTTGPYWWRLCPYWWRLCPYWWRLCPNPVVARMALEEFPEIFSAVSWKSRVALAFQRGSILGDMPSMLPAMLGFHRVNTQVAQARDYSGSTCLHEVAEQTSRVVDTSLGMVGFVRQLLACGAGLHDRTNVGDTPLMTFLKNKSKDNRATNIRVWIQLLEAAGIDLEDYGRTEFAMWDALPNDDNKNKDIRIMSFSFGPRVKDWVIERQRGVLIPIYELTSAPGTWPDESTHKIRTVCWDPCYHREDDPRGTSQWKQVRQVTVWVSDENPPDVPLNNPVIREMFRDLEEGTQDDCGSVTRLLATGHRPHSRPRRYSQPASGRVLNRSQRHIVRPYWLPKYHICVDGRLRLAYSDSERSCAKGLHSSTWDHDYHNAIKREMRQFQMRYTSPEDLPSLPYAAYHLMWKGDWRPREDGGLEEL